MIKLRARFKDNLVILKSLDFVRILISVVEKLKEERWFTVSDQIFRSGSSIGANLFEAQNAQSRKDFIHKCKIAAKEADETYYWLLVLEMIGFEKEAEQLETPLDEVSKILNSIISSSTKNSKN
jgi:four helix bundle protein